MSTHISSEQGSGGGGGSEMAPLARVSHEGGGLWLAFRLSSEGGDAGLCFRASVCLRASQ